MAFAFPAATTTGQQYSFDNTTWEWNGTVWKVLPSFGDIRVSVATSNEIDTQNGKDLVLDSATGNTKIDDALQVTGASTFDTTVNVTGAATFADALDVTGATTLNSTLDVAGAATMATTLDVTGAAVMASTLGVTGATTLSDTLDVTGVAAFTTNVGMGGTLTVAQNCFLGPTDVNGPLMVLGDVDILQTLEVMNTTITHDIHPDSNNTRDLGTSTFMWKDAYINKIEIGDMTIDGNTNTFTSYTNEIILDPAPAGDGGDVTVKGNITVTGSSGTDGNMIVTGNLTVNGTTTTVNSTTVTLDDPVMTLGGDTAAASDDGLDRGIEFRWHDGAAGKVGFFGWDRSDQKFTFIADATNTGEVFTGTKAAVAFGAADFTGNVVPSADVTYDLGAVSAKWNNGHFENLFATNMTIPSVTFGNIQLAITDDQTIDTSAGDLVLSSFTGLTLVDDNLRVTGLVATDGDVQVAGSIEVTMNATIGGTASISSSLSAIGPISTNNTLTVTGATTLNSTLDVAGAATMATTLDVTGAAVMASTLGVTGATTLSDTLGVSGVTTLSDALDVYGTTKAQQIEPHANATHDIGTSAARWKDIFAGSIDVTGAGTISGNLGVSGTTTLGNTLNVTGASTMKAIQANTIKAETDLTYDLGAATTRWSNVYTEKVQMIDPAAPATNIALTVAGNDLYVDGVKVGGSATVDTAAPSDPDEGMFWMDRNSGILYIYVVNASTGSGNWIQPL
jgi:hypothetical protein